MTIGAGIAAAALVTVGGLALLQRQSDSPASTQPPSVPQQAADVELAPGGVMILDDLPSELTNAQVSGFSGPDPVAGLVPPADDWVRRWYTATMEQPELSPRLEVASASTSQRIEPPTVDDVTEVTVQGVEGWLYDDPFGAGRVAAFHDGETMFILTGYELTDDDLLRAAEHVGLADASSIGAVVDTGALPTGLRERAVGTAFESQFLPIEAQEHPSPTIRWDEGETMLWIRTITEDPALLPLHRLGHDTVTDTTVHGQPAFATTLATQPEYVGVTWFENGITYLLESNGLDPDTVLDIAEHLRPATATEWEQLLRATEERSSTVPATASPTPTTMVMSPPPVIDAGSVVCVDAGASQFAVSRCVDELGGEAIEASVSSAETFVMPIDAENPLHNGNAATVSGALNVQLRELDERFVPEGFSAPEAATTYLVLGESDAPYVVDPPPTTAPGGSLRVTDVEQVHAVVDGDTIESIAGQYGFPSTQLDALLGLNGWSSTDVDLVPGEIVRIPPGAVINPIAQP